MANNENSTENNVLSVPYVAYESALNRFDKHNKWLIIIIIILVVLLAATNMIWVYEWNQYDYVDEVTTVDAGNGIANYIGDDGDITNGENNEAGENPNEA